MNQNNTVYVKKFYPPPPFINSVLQYENVNRDPNLKEMITTFYLKKAIKWLKNYDDFAKAKKNLSIIEGPKGYNIIYKLLKRFINNTNVNWYDMKEKYSVVKDYLKYKLSSL